MKLHYGHPRVRMVFDLGGRGSGARLKLPTVTLSNYRIAYETYEHYNAIAIAIFVNIKMLDVPGGVTI